MKLKIEKGKVRGWLIYPGLDDQPYDFVPGNPDRETQDRVFKMWQDNLIAYMAFSQDDTCRFASIHPCKIEYRLLDYEDLPSAIKETCEFENG